MKSSSAALRSVLYDNPAHRVADLLAFYFDAGVQRYTNSGANITVGSDTYLSAHISPVEVVQSLGTDVERVEVKFAPAGQTVSGLSFIAAALSGLFRRVRVEVKRAATLTSFASVAAADLMTVFDGIVTEVGIDSKAGVLTLFVESPLALADTPASQRVVQAQCPFALGDANCGVALASFRDTRTVAAGSTAQVIVLSSSSARAAPGSVLTLTSGALSGQARTVRSVAGASCTLDGPLPGVPAVGDGVRVENADDKTRNTCATVFGNALRFGGFVNAPEEE